MEIKIVLDEKLLDNKDYDFFHYDSSYKLAMIIKNIQKKRGKENE